MPSQKLDDVWDKICNQYLSGNISKANKVAAYKVFLRPILTYCWFDQRTDLKLLELKALRKIFGDGDVEDIYSKYPDLELNGHFKIQELKWKHATSSFARIAKKLVTNNMKKVEVISVFGIPITTKKSKCKEDNTNVGIVIADEDRRVALRRSKRIASRRRKQRSVRSP